MNPSLLKIRANGLIQLCTVHIFIIGVIPRIVGAIIIVFDESEVHGFGKTNMLAQFIKLSQ